MEVDVAVNLGDDRTVRDEGVEMRERERKDKDKDVRAKRRREHPQALITKLSNRINAERKDRVVPVNVETREEQVAFQVHPPSSPTLPDERLAKTQRRLGPSYLAPNWRAPRLDAKPSLELLCCMRLVPLCKHYFAWLGFLTLSIV